jgi:photosystem II stability/assembly factor-like uncharacterized protein
MYKYTQRRLHSLFLAASFLTLLTLILAGCGSSSQSGSTPPRSGSATPTISGSTPVALPTPTPTQISPLPTPTRSAKPAVPFTLMRMLDQQHGWALTASSILKTADGGRTWQDVTPSPFNSLANPVAVFYNPLIAWVTITKPFGGGKTYQLIHTIDGGQTWTTQTAQINVQGIEVLDINFINAHEGWMEIDEGSGAGQQGAGIVHTTDGGVNWNLVSTSISPPKGVGFFSYSGRKTGLSFANSSTGWAGITTYGSKQSFAFVTHNGGITWTSQNLPLPISGKEVMGGTTPPIIFGQDIVMPALENGGFTLYLSSNGGATWQANPQVFPSGQRTTVGKDNIYVVDPTHAWAIDSQGVLYITTNGGRSWSFHSTLQNVSQLSFISHTIGWAYSGQGQKVPTLLKTTDGGQSWSKINYSIY